MTSDTKPLNELAARSEAYWGFDESHMKAFRRRCAVGPDHLKNGHVFVLEKDGELLGFYSLSRRKTGYELEHCYVDPSHIGKGLGRTLWQHLRTFCIRLGIKDVTIICSDFVKGFYLQMGATYLGQVESKLDRGAMIAKLRYRIYRAKE